MAAVPDKNGGGASQEWRDAIYNGGGPDKNGGGPQRDAGSLVRGARAAAELGRASPRPRGRARPLR
eukprot:3661340-Rhodomonas_salina.1